MACPWQGGGKLEHCFGNYINGKITLGTYLVVSKNMHTQQPRNSTLKDTPNICVCTQTYTYSMHTYHVTYPRKFIASLFIIVSN